MNWEKFNIIKTIYYDFYSYFTTACNITVEVFHPYEPRYNPEVMKNFPYDKFNRYVFISYLFHLNFVLIKTNLGIYYFRWVKSLNSTVKIHGEKFLLSNPPIWIKIVHLVERKKSFNLH